MLCYQLPGSKTQMMGYHQTTERIRSGGSRSGLDLMLISEMVELRLILLSASGMEFGSG